MFQVEMLSLSGPKALLFLQLLITLISTESFPIVHTDTVLDVFIQYWQFR